MAGSPCTVPARNRGPGPARPDRDTQPSAQDQAAHEQARGLFKQLRTNTLAAYQEAEQVLTDAQKTQARTLLETERRSHGPGHGGRGSPRQGE